MFDYQMRNTYDVEFSETGSQSQENNDNLRLCCYRDLDINEFLVFGR